MTVSQTCSYIAHETKQVFVDLKDDIKTSLKNFQAAPGKEKTWVLIKTVCVAIACGLIGAALGAVIGSGIGAVAVGVTAFVVGGVYAFYRFARTARKEEEIFAQNVVHNVKQNTTKVTEVLVDQGTHVAETIGNGLDQMGKGFNRVVTTVSETFKPKNPK